MTMPPTSAGRDTEPRPRNFSDALLRLVVNGYRRTPASAGALVAGIAVEPHLEWIRSVGGSETRSAKIEGRAFSQRAEVGSLRNTPTTNGGRRGALIDQWAFLVGRWEPRVVVFWDRIGLVRERNCERIRTTIRTGDVRLHVSARQRHLRCRVAV